MIRPNREQYDIRRREMRKKTDGKALKGFAMDLTLRVSNGGSTFFLQDLNSKKKNQVMPFESREEIVTFFAAELERNWNEHYHG